MVERTLISLPSQVQLIERLQHLIYLSSSLIFVSGEAGSGKSTLTENLSNSLNTDLQQIYISLSNAPSVEKLRQQIVGQLYENPLFNSADNLLDSVLRLQASESKDSNKLLIIDSAEHLPEGFVIELCELFSGEDFVRDGTLNILLLADEKTNQKYLDYIEDNLIGRMQASLNHVEFKLPSLSVQESLSLLQHNFEQFRYQPEIEGQDALNRKLKECAGNPKKIIQLANSLSQESVLPPRKYWLKTAFPAILLMLLLAGVVSALGTYLYPKFIAHEKVESQPEIVIEDVVEKTQKDVLLEHLLIQEKRMQEALAGEWDDANVGIENSQQDIAIEDKKDRHVVVSDEKIEKLVHVVTTNAKNLLDNEDDTSTTSLPLTPSEDESLPIKDENEQFLPIDGQQKEYSEDLLSSVRERVWGENKGKPPFAKVSEVVEPLVPNVVLPDVETVAIKSNIEQSKLENNQVEAPKSLPKEKILAQPKAPILPASNVVAIKENKTEFTPTSVLLNKSGTHYTLQLSGMASKRYFDLFKQQSVFPQENLFLYETVYQNKPWFVVLYGDFYSVQSAQLATKNLPDYFKGMSSWVKQWQLVHNELRLNDE